MGELDGLRGTEGDLDHTSAINHTDIDGIGPGSKRNQHVADTNPLRRDTGPGGQLGEQGEPGDVEDDQECQSDGDGVETDGR